MSDPAASSPRVSQAPEVPQTPHPTPEVGSTDLDGSAAIKAMRPVDVPDELVLRALSASAGKPPTTDIYDLIDYDLDDHEAMTRALAAVLPAHEQMVRAKVAEEVYEADYAHRPLWADEEELAEGHFQDRDLTWWMTLLGHPKAHRGCCKTCGCATTCTAGAFLDAVTATATRIARGGA